MSTLILASASIARKRLLKELKMPFKVYASGYVEKMNIYKNPAKLAKFLALEKAKFVANRFPDSTIIGADTFIVVGNKKIGKPKNVADAKKIIASMSNKAIKIYTGIAVVKTSPNSAPHLKILKTFSDYAVSKLKIRKITPAEITKLTSHPRSLKIAGGFSIEDNQHLIEKIHGDYNNVVGLPLFKLKKLLAKNK